MQIVFLLALPVLMYFLLIRPQQRRLKEQKALLSAVEEGDEIVTTGGIYGYVNAVEDDTIWLEVAEGVEMRIAKGAVMKRIPASDASVPDTLPASVTDGTDPPDITDAADEPAVDPAEAADETPKAGPETER